MCVDPITIAAIGQTLGASSLFTVGTGGVLAATGTATGIATAASVGMAAMTGMSAFGSMQQGNQMQQMGEYNAQVAQNQAIAARQKADFDYKQQQRQASQFKGSQRLAMAGTGGELLDMGDIQDMTATDLELESLGIKYGSTMDQTAEVQRARLARMEGNVKKQQAYGQAGSTLLTGAKSGLALV
tara:strand:+ start:3875 stop:4429 length:555 start_codon:yes stop_codon:yes gene_type:complete